MIQRIQSVYLLLTIVLAIIFLAGPVLKFNSDTGQDIVLNISGIHNGSTEELPGGTGSTLPLTLLLIIVPLTAAVVLILFRNRKVQIVISSILIILAAVCLVLLAFYSVLISRKYNVSFEPGFNTIIPVIVMILSILARRGIRKDEDLVKSYERLR